MVFNDILIISTVYCNQVSIGRPLEKRLLTKGNAPKMKCSYEWIFNHYFLMT